MPACQLCWPLFKSGLHFTPTENESSNFSQALDYICSCHSEIHCRSSREAVPYHPVQQEWYPVKCRRLNLGRCLIYPHMGIRGQNNGKVELDVTLLNSCVLILMSAELRPQGTQKMTVCVIIAGGNVGTAFCNQQPLVVWLCPQLLDLSEKKSFWKDSPGHIRVPKSEQRLKLEWSVNEDDTYHLTKKKKETWDRITFWMDFPNISLYFWVHFQHLKTHKHLGANGLF